MKVDINNVNLKNVVVSGTAVVRGPDGKIKGELVFNGKGVDLDAEPKELDDGTDTRDRAAE